MDVALDLEEVLADTIRESCNSTDNISMDDFQEWDLDTHTWQVYNGVSDALWRHDPLSIPQVEPNLGEKVGHLHQNADKLDIVTARLHVDEQIETWLEEYDIPYDTIISTRAPKYEMDYDVFIDDNPEMLGECRLLLRDHPHNRSIVASESKTTDRIFSLREASTFIR